MNRIEREACYTLGLTSIGILILVGIIFMGFNYDNYGRDLNNELNARFETCLPNDDLWVDGKMPEGFPVCNGRCSGQIEETWAKTYIVAWCPFEPIYRIEVVGSIFNPKLGEMTTLEPEYGR